MTVGDRLKYFRELAGISVADAARELGISRDTLRYRIEKYRIAGPRGPTGQEPGGHG